MAGSVVAIVPARYGSTRLPGKPLALIGGRPLVRHAYELAARVRGVDRVVVATDDERIYDAVKQFGGEVRMTRADHASGTDRVAEVARTLDARLVVNVQGDLLDFDPASVEGALASLSGDSPAAMSTLMTALTDDAEWRNPNVVKVVTDQDGYALYFSRSPIPHRRDRRPDSHDRRAAVVLGYRHVGVYAYRHDFLLTFARLRPTPLEHSEKLEQLRALEWGYRIRVVETEGPVIEVDTPEDLRRAQGRAYG